MTASQPALDAALASTLFPSVLRIAHLAAAPADAAPADPTDAASDPKLELSKQAASLHSTLATLSAQAAALPAGNLSLEDQAWLIGQLEAEVARKREELGRMAQLTQLAKDGAPKDEGDVKMDEAA
ncbi:hypothetical protein JCM10450v2_001200 [Rhodotorula kratochvilovae]